jgi:hypothetical protein
MAAFNADYFGSKNVGTVYGLMINRLATRWCARFTVDLLYVRRNRRAFYSTPGVMLLNSIIPFVVRPAKREASVPAGAEARA